MSEKLNTNLKRTVNAVLEKYHKAKKDYERGVDGAEDFLIRQIMDATTINYDVKDVRDALDKLTEDN